MTHKEANRHRKEKSVSQPSMLVLGVGNILLSDEGIGIRVIEAMEDWELPDNVELFDGGTASVGLLDSLANRDKVIIIDTVKGGNKPGTLYRFTPDDMAIQRESLTSLHQVGLLETLKMAEYLGCEPREVIILGIEPEKISWGLELSPEVAGVVPRVIKLVLSELGG